MTNLSAGAPPQTPLGELTAFPRPLAGFEGRSWQGRGGAGEEEKEGREGEVDGRERELGPPSYC